MLRPNEPGIRLNVGTSGSGKTFKLKNEAYDAAEGGLPLLVVDTAEEWTGLPKERVALSKLTRGYASKDAVKEAIADLDSRKVRMAIIQGQAWETVGNEVCEWAIKEHMSRPDRLRAPRGIAVSEAHNLWPLTASLSRAEKTAATAWRHRAVAMFLDTQRLASLHPLFREQARVLCAFAVAGKRDLEVIREIGGAELAKEIVEAARLLQEHEDGKRDDGQGWYVKLGLSKLGPYTLVRD